MGTNTILEFGDTAGNEYADAAYAALAQRVSGVVPGVADDKLANKVWHQVSVIAAGIAQFIADRQAANISDALTPAQVAGYLAAALPGFTQTWQGVTGSRAAGVTYTNSTPLPIHVNVTATLSAANSNAVLVINGTINVVGSGNTLAGAPASSVYAVIPPGATYLLSATLGTPTVSTWSELR